MELVVLVEQFTNRIDFQELSAATSTNVTAKICNLVGEVDITLLTQHTDSSKE